MTICTVLPYTDYVQIRSIRHEGLKRFVEDDDPKGLRRDLVDRIRNVLTALIVAEDLTSLQSLPGWRVHLLTGDRKGTWSISVSGNWRITFELAGDDICNLNLEDYH